MKKYFNTRALLFSMILTACGFKPIAQSINIDMRSYIIPEKKIYYQGERIRVRFSGFPGFQNDWIGVYKQGHLNRDYTTWQYTGGTGQGTIELRVPTVPGKYELRGFPDNRYDQFVVSEIITVRSADVTAYNTDWSGVWRTSYSELTINQSGNTISGTYGNNKIIGSANGNIITGWWKEVRAEGRFEFVMSADGKTFMGKWGNNYDDLSKPWNGTRIITNSPLTKASVNDNSTTSKPKTGDRPLVSVTKPGQIAASDLAGIWDATGYTCESPVPLEKIKITFDGNKLIAVKITGDNCVPKGETTWEGTLSGNIISARGRVSSGPGTPRRWLDGITIKVTDKNTLEGFLGVTFRRK